MPFKSTEEGLSEGKDINMRCFLSNLLINLFIMENLLLIQTVTECFTITETYILKIAKINGSCVRCT
jgi:hypothetical protein